MPLKDYLPLMKFVGTLVVPVLYIVSFASKEWVTEDNIEWGLWQWCYTNFTDVDHPPDHVNDTSKCHGISPGDSPSYYEAVRTIGTFTVVFHILYFCTFNENEGLGKDKNPIKVALVAMLGSVTTLAILGAKYKDDERWAGRDPSLGWCFWTVTSCAVLNCFMMGVFFKFDQMKKGGSSSTVADRPQPPPRRASNASILSIDRGRKIIIFRTSDISSNSGGGGTASPRPQSSHGETSGGGGGGEPSASAQPSSGGRRNGADSSDSSGSQFPVLTLPLYDIAPDPERGFPSVHPPSYEEVTRAGALSPPPAYTVTSFGAQKKE